MSKRSKARRGKAIGRANRRIKNLQTRVNRFDPRDGCKIPSLPGEPEETHNLQGCHLISESAYLIPISTRNHVLHWRFDARAIADSILREQTYSYTQVAPRPTPTRKCTTRYACNFHDRNLFEEIDKGDLDPQSKHHRFLLGFRAIAGSIAEWESWVEYFESLPSAYYASDPRAEDRVKIRLMTLNPYMKEAKTILKRWQDAYREKKWNGIHSCHEVATSRLRCAASSTFDIGGGLGTLTLLPIVLDGRPTGRYDIFCVALKSPWTKPWDRLFQPRLLKQAALYLKENLEQDPGRALEWMAGKMGHVAINPDDYNNRELISSEDISRIERAAASRLQ